MSSSARRAIAAAVAALSLSALSVVAWAPPTWAAPGDGAGRATPATASTAAQAGAAWLGQQFTSGGYIREKHKPSPGETAEAILALAAAGVGQTQAQAGVTWLESNFESYVSPGGVDDAAALANVILAADAMGVDPMSFGGTGTSNNLVARLIATQQTSGPDAGLFGSQAPTYDGAFRQGLALMALAEAGDANAAGVAWLQDQQCSDGGWEAYRADLSQACAAPDPTTYAGPDTNSTSMAVQGLVAMQSLMGSQAAFGVDPTTFFESAQNADGGFGFIGTSSQSPDPDSTGEVIQALVALGQLTNPAFTQTGGTPMSALAAFQLGCSASKAKRGAYVYPGEKGPNILATLQAVPGAAEVAFPLPAQTLQPGLPKLTCPAH